MIVPREASFALSSAFGFRLSDFFRISDFGFRTSRVLAKKARTDPAPVCVVYDIGSWQVHDMRRCWVVWLLLGCGLAVVICAVALNSDHEPRYGGRSLSQWLLIHRQAQIDGRHIVDWWALGVD